MNNPPEFHPFVPYDPTSAKHVSLLTVIVDRATRADGQPPFSDQSLVDLRTGAAEGIVIEHDDSISGLAVLGSNAVPREAELVVAPHARHRGLGSRLLGEVLERTNGSVRIWAHGDHPDARALAARLGLVPVRELLQLRLEPVSGHENPAVVTPFRPGRDDAEWLALNAVAFANHPEQGRITQNDLDARMAEDWFEAEDFLIARDPDGSMTGFCWLKVEGTDDGDPVGEFYAVAVSPAAQGRGLGRQLVNAGLARFESSGIRIASLYVEAENAPAVALYRSVGFTDYTIDVQYASVREEVSRLAGADGK